MIRWIWSLETRSAKKARASAERFRVESTAQRSERMKANATPIIEGSGWKPTLYSDHTQATPASSRTRIRETRPMRIRRRLDNVSHEIREQRRKTIASCQI